MMKEHLINIQSSILDALASLNRLSGKVMTLLVVDDDQHLAGTVTDGDIRRGLLRGLSTADSIRQVVNTAFTALPSGASDLERMELIRCARERNLKLLPETDRQGHLTGIVDLSVTHTVLPLSAILMAGGLGERLRPLTLSVPKPLLKVGGRPIIDYNIENLARCGIADVWIMVRYHADMLRDYFSVSRHGIHAECIEETIPMGTLGAASLVPLPAAGNTLIMNSDLLTTIDLEEMYMRHMDTGADITVAAIPYTSSVPYAILRTEGDRVTDIAEKPTTTSLANAGIYIFSNSLLARLPQTERTDAPDFILKAMAEGCKVSYYPITGTWIDIGSPQEFAHANELMRHHRSLNGLS